MISEELREHLEKIADIIGKDLKDRVKELTTTNKELKGKYNWLKDNFNELEKKYDKVKQKLELITRLPGDFREVFNMVCDIENVIKSLEGDWHHADSVIEAVEEIQKILNTFKKEIGRK